MSGHVVKLNGAPIAWGSLKQTVVAQYSTTAAFIAANDSLGSKPTGSISS